MTDLLTADAKTVNKRREELGIPYAHKYRPCFCNWGLDCARYQLMFASRGDIRGDQPFKLSISATYKQKVAKWKSILERHVLSSKAVDATGVVVLARHHWSREQLEYMQEHQMRPSTSVSLQVAKQTAFSFDATAKCPSISDTIEYFHTPNVPKRVVETEAKLLFDQRTIRREERQAKLKEQKLLQEKRAFEKLSFEGYQTQQKTLQDTISSLQQKVQALSSENEELKTSAKTLKKENSSFRKANQRRMARKKQKRQHGQGTPIALKSPPPRPSEANATREQVRAATAARSASAAAVVPPQFPPTMRHGPLPMQMPQQGTGASTAAAAAAAAVAASRTT